MDLEERLARVRQYIEGFNSGDPDTVVDALDPGVMLEPLVGTRTPGTDLERLYRGHDAFVEMLNEARAQGAEYIRLDDYAAHGDAGLLAEVTLIGRRPAGTGVAESGIAAVGFKRGRIAYGGIFKDREAAVERLQSLGY